jgi:O-antigen ligase
MKAGAIHKTFFAAALAMGAVAAFFSALLQNFYLLAVPVTLVVIYFALQFPQLLLYGLIASVPWSVQTEVTAALSTDLPDEPLMLLCALAALVLIISRKENMQWRWHPVSVILLLMMIWMGVTVVLSSDKIISLKYLLAKSWYLLAFTAAPLLLLRTKTEVRRAGAVLICSMLGVVLLTMVRHAEKGFSFEGINDALQPFYINHVNYSALLVCTLPPLVTAISFAGKKYRALFLMALVLGIVAVYFSYSRGAWLALAAGTISYWLVRKRIIVFTFILILFTTLAAVWWFHKDDRYLEYAHDHNTTIFHEDFREHLVATYQLKDVSNAERFYRWIAGVRMTGDSWRTGFGPNTFYSHYKSYTIPAFKTWVSNNPEHSTVHNYFLLLLIEQGVPGLILFVVLLALLFSCAQKIYHRAIDPFWKSVSVAMASVLTMICTVNFLSDLIEADEVGSIFFLCIAVLIIADRQTKKESDPAPHIERVA